VSKAPENGCKNEESKPDVTPLQTTIKLARRGVKEVLPRLRKLLDEHPELIGHYDDLARRAQQAWLELFGKDLLAREGTARQLDALRQDLAKSRASPLERLVIQRIAACWLQTVYFDAREAVGQDLESREMAEFRLKRQSQAHQQLLSAIRSLADLRKVAPPPVIVQISAEAHEAASGNSSTARCPVEHAGAAHHRPVRTNGHHHNRIAALMGADQAAGVG
jgi:hypothetical protein